MLRLLDIPPHPLVSQERTYIAAWDDMGFDDEALPMAYEKTVLKKQSMDWGYMNGILRRWHQKGLHTAAAIQAGDRDPRPLRLPAASGGSGGPGEADTGKHGADAPYAGPDEEGRVNLWHMIPMCFAGLWTGWKGSGAREG